ncbi:MAG: P-loop NTPase, partial [bacterium]
MQTNTESNQVTLADWMERLRPQHNALAFVPKDLALASGVLPLYFEGETLVVAVADPVNLQKLSGLQFTLGRRIGMIRVPRAALSAATRATYGQVAVPEVNGLVDAVAAPREIRRMPQVRQVFEPGTMNPRVIAVTSGKGGVGKTTLTTNLAVAMSMLGLRVGMVDCDFGLANLHLAMGIRPEFTLADVVLGGRDPIACMAPGFAGVRLLSGTDGVATDTSWNYSTLRTAGCGFDIFRMHFDVTLVDTAAGVHDSVTSALAAVDHVLMVITPDPSSIHDAYVTTKTLLEQKPDASIDIVVNQALSEADSRLMFAKFQ